MLNFIDRRVVLQRFCRPSILKICPLWSWCICFSKQCFLDNPFLATLGCHSILWGNGWSLKLYPRYCKFAFSLYTKSYWTSSRSHCRGKTQTDTWTQPHWIPETLLWFHFFHWVYLLAVLKRGILLSSMVHNAIMFSNNNFFIFILLKNSDRCQKFKKMCFPRIITWSIGVVSTLSTQKFLKQFFFGLITANRLTLDLHI